jgi:hypothetical protein
MVDAVGNITAALQSPSGYNTSGRSSITENRRLAGSTTLEITVSTPVTESTNQNALESSYTTAVAAGASDNSLIDSIASEVNSGVNASQSESAAFISAVSSNTISIPAVSVATTNYSPTQAPTQTPTVPTAAPTALEVDTYGLNVISMGLVGLIIGMCCVAGTWRYFHIEREKRTKVVPFDPEKKEDAVNMDSVENGAFESPSRVLGSNNARVGIAPTDEVLAASPVSPAFKKLFDEQKREQQQLQSELREVRSLALSKQTDDKRMSSITPNTPSTPNEVKNDANNEQLTAKITRLESGLLSMIREKQAMEADYKKQSDKMASDLRKLQVAEKIRDLSEQAHDDEIHDLQEHLQDLTKEIAGLRK